MQSDSIIGFVPLLAGFFALYVAFLIVVILITVFLFIIPLWKIFTKAGKPGWVAIIPFYNIYVLVQVARLSVYYFILILAPSLFMIAEEKISLIVDIVLAIVFGIAILVAWCIVNYNLAKQFGKGIGYTIGLFFLPFIFYPMLGYGSSVYQQEDSLSHSDVPSGNNPTATSLTEQPSSQMAEQVTQTEPQTPTQTA